MKVKDLIEKLSKMDLELEVVIKQVDSDDFVYELPLRDQDVKIKKVWEVDSANLEENQSIKAGDKCLVIELSFE